MTVMYNNLQATEKEKDDPNKEKIQRHHRKIASAPNRSSKANSPKGTIMQTIQAGGTPFRKILF